MNVLVEYVFDKDEVDTLCALIDYLLGVVDTPESIRAIKHLQEPLLVSQEILSYGDERKG